MADTPNAFESPRQWSPQTKDDFRALKLYDDDTISRIAEVLPGFAQGRDRDELAGLIRQLARCVIASRRGASRTKPAAIRDKLKTAATHLRKAKALVDEVLLDLARVLPLERLGGDYLIKNMDYVLSTSRVLKERVALVELATKSIKVTQGRYPDEDLKWAVEQLCEIYRIMTGKLPRRRYDAIEEEHGPLESFISAAIEPLWPDRGGAGRYVREAVSRYRNHRPDG